VAAAGYIFMGVTLYIHIFQGAKMSLFSYSLAFLCMKHGSFGGGWGGG